MLDSMDEGFCFDGRLCGRFAKHVPLDVLKDFNFGLIRPENRLPELVQLVSGKNQTVNFGLFFFSEHTQTGDHFIDTIFSSVFFLTKYFNILIPGVLE